MRDNGGELAERVGTRCEQLGVLPREQGEGVCPLEVGHDQGNSVVPHEVEEVSWGRGERGPPAFPRRRPGLWQPLLRWKRGGVVVVVGG